MRLACASMNHTRSWCSNSDAQTCNEHQQRCRPNSNPVLILMADKAPGCVPLGGHQRLSPWLDSMLIAAFPVAYEIFTPLCDVQTSITKYQTPYAADAAFGAEYDCWSNACIWQSCSQASPPAERVVMDTSTRWTMISALTSQASMMTAFHGCFNVASKTTQSTPSALDTP